MEYRLHSQLTGLNESTENIKRRIDAPTLREENTQVLEEEFNPGLELHQVRSLLDHYGARVELHYAAYDDGENVALFTQCLKETLNCSKKLIITNFHGGYLGAGSKGHFSTLAAYNKQSDSVLVLDTACHKNPWFWAPVRQFYQAMHQGEDGKMRGYLIVS